MSSPMQTLQNQLDPLRRRYASLTPSERWVVNGVALMVVLVSSSSTNLLRQQVD